MMKKIVSLMLVIVMLFSLSGFTYANNYTDLTKDNEKYVTAVSVLTELNIIDGFKDGTFRPQDNLTRAQIAKMLVICMGLEDIGPTQTSFSDVDTEHWASGYIKVASQAKLIVGYPDGTFKPEKEVSYAEAITMVLRALGYGNVVDSEGTWPTAYMLKAVELELTDDMEDIVANKPATRGNTAILLWNMLRTEMWRISSESEGNGMTKTNTGDYMLNVKFPKYDYSKGLYISNVAIDELDVYVTVETENGTLYQTAKVQKDTDIARLLIGEKVTVLIKDFKDKDKATFLLLIPEYDIVEGLITKVSEGKIEINNVEYRAELEVEENDYVVIEVNNKKVIDEVYKILPSYAQEATKSSIKKMDEDTLVIIDGIWGTENDMKEGDVYTILDDVDGEYYMVSRERAEGEFESLTFERDVKEIAYFEVGDGIYQALKSRIEENKFAYVGEEVMTDVVKKLTMPEKENEYIGRDVELYKNYLGLVWRAYFSEEKANAVNGNFYVVISNGVREVSNEDETVLKIKLANEEYPQGKWYTFKNSVELEDFEGSLLEKDSIYGKEEDTEGIFVWAKVNNKNQLTALSVIPLNSGDNFNSKSLKPYDDKYDFAAFDADDYDKSNKYIGDFKVTSDTVILEAVPVIDEDDLVESFEFRVAENVNKTLNAANGGLIAWDTTSKINTDGGSIKLAKFVFLTSDAEVSELQAGKVSKVKISSKGTFVTIDGEEYEIDTDKFEDNAMDLDKKFIVYAETNNDKIIIKNILETEELLNAWVVFAKSGSLIKISGDNEIIELDTDLNENGDKSYRKYDVIQVEASENKDGIIEFTEGKYSGQGLKSGTFSVGDRIIIDDENKIIYICSIEDCSEKDSLVFDEYLNGIVIYTEEEV